MEDCDVSGALGRHRQQAPKQLGPSSTKCSDTDTQQVQLRTWATDMDIQRRFVVDVMFDGLARHG